MVDSTTFSLIALACYEFYYYGRLGSRRAWSSSRSTRTIDDLTRRIVLTSLKTIISMLRSGRQRLVVPARRSRTTPRVVITCLCRVR
jgi:hypothetical protein